MLYGVFNSVDFERFISSYDKWLYHDILIVREGSDISLWLNDRQPVKVVKTPNDRQFYIFDKFRKSE